MSGIGHNQGPTMERGKAWRRHAWGKARAELLPKLPLEIVRIRVRRAAELGLDYKCYAGFRAANGRDVVAFLFSTSALRVYAPKAGIPKDRRARLAAIKKAERIALAPGSVRDKLRSEAEGLLDVVGTAPDLTDAWPEVRAKLRAVTAGRKLPGDGVLVIGDTALEREWSAAGRLGGFLTAERDFGETP